MAVEELVAAVAAAVPDCGARSYELGGPAGIMVEPASVGAVLAHFKNDGGFDQLIDVTCVDREAGEGTLEVVYNLRRMRDGLRLCVKAALPAADPRVATASSLWPAAGWPEREVFDMFGVHFDGHADLRRILMYEEFEGYPLRKSYDYRRRQPLVEERDPIHNPWPQRKSAVGPTE